MFVVRALGGAAVPAPHMRDPERLLAAREGRDDLAGDPVDGLRVAVQPDRVGTVPDPGQRLGPGVEPGRGEQVRDLPLQVCIQSRRVQRRGFAEVWEGVGEEGGQGGGHVRPSPRGHRPHRPEKGVPRGQFAIPPRGTPGPGSPRSPAQNGSRRRDRCNAETQPIRVVSGPTKSLSLFVCNGCLCVRPLARWGADPRGNCPVVFVCEVVRWQRRCHTPPTTVEAAPRTVDNPRLGD